MSTHLTTTLKFLGAYGAGLGLFLAAVGLFFTGHNAEAGVAFLSAVHAFANSTTVSQQSKLADITPALYKSKV